MHSMRGFDLLLAKYTLRACEACAKMHPRRVVPSLHPPDSLSRAPYDDSSPGCSQPCSSMHEKNERHITWQHSRQHVRVPV